MSEPPLREPATGELLVVGPVTRADVPALCERLRRSADGADVEAIACDVAALVADDVALEALLRLALVGRRLGCRVQLRRVAPSLQALLDLCGLEEILPCEALRLEPCRQPEQREQALGVQERDEPGDARA